MKTSRRTFLTLLPGTIAGAATLAAAEAGKSKVLIVTGGHGFEKEPFFQMFKDNAGITFEATVHQKNADAFERDDLTDFDAVVLYDMVRDITEPQKAKFLSLFQKGVGLVVLHHALVSYQHWSDYERIIGGTYPEPDDQRGKVTEKFGYEHDVDLDVVIVAKNHPITSGVKDFKFNDEIYWGFRVGADSKPLITTTHPKSGKPLGWYRNEGKSRVVYLQSGHGPSAYNDSNFRKLLAQSIRWVSEK